jgi:hypothetical protein
MSVSRPQNPEIPLTSLLLPQFEKAFIGFSRDQLHTVLGDRSISNLLASPDEYWVDRGSVAFFIRPDKTSPAIARIHGYITAPHPSVGRPYSSLGINAFNLNGENQERGVRIFWCDAPEKHHGQGYKVTNLFLDEIQILPLEGELFYTRNGKNGKLVQPARERKPKLEGEGLGSQDQMHVIKLVTEGLRQTTVAVNGSGIPYESIEVKSGEGGIYHIWVHKDNVIFKSDLILTIPGQIKIDRINYRRTLGLLK